MKTRLIKQDITVKTDEEVMRVLLDGYVVKERRCSELLKLREGAFLWDNGVHFKLGNLQEYVLEVYKEEQIPWYENIPEQGILCWLSDDSPEYKSYFGKVFSRDKGGFASILPFKYATPVTLEEIKQYILEEEKYDN